MPKTSPDHHTVNLILKKFLPDDALVKVVQLKGGVSHHVSSITTKTNSGKQRVLILKCYEGFDWKDSNIHSSRREFEILDFLIEKGLRVPKPYFFDNSLDILSSPYTLIDFIEGDTQSELDSFPKRISNMAMFLAALHKISTKDLMHLQVENLESPLEGCFKFLPRVKGIENYAELIQKLKSFTLHKNSKLVLNHGDFWPNNIIWKNEEVAGVIDWEDISLGDPMADLATARIELFCMYGREVTESFSLKYLNESKFETKNLPIWEIYAAAAAIATMDSWELNQQQKTERLHATTVYLANTIKEFCRDQD